MKSKFLNAALLSALVAGAPFAATSCKDYDDDINKNETAIADLQKQLSAVQSSIDGYRSEAAAAAAAAQAAADKAQNAANGSADAAAAANQAAADAAAQAAAAQAKADALQGLYDSLKAQLDNGLYTQADKDAFNALKEQVSGIDSKLGELLGQAENPTFAGAIAALQTQVQALENYKAQLEKLNLAAELEKLGGLNKAIESVNSLINGLTNTTGDLQQKLDNVANQISAINSNLVTINGTNLRSLVFVPEFYWGGIEAMKVNTFVYRPFDLKPVNANGRFNGDAPKYNVEDSVRVTPALKATYHINPSSAIMPTDVAKYKLLAGNYNYEQAHRGDNAVVTPTVYEVKVAGGDVTIKANLKGGRLPVLADEGKLTSMALQVTVNKNGQDTTVTSDYAGVKGIDSNGFWLANAQQPATSHQQHWPTTAAHAIEIDSVIPVAWNSTVSISKYVDTHFRDYTNAADKILDAYNGVANATNGHVQEYGFVYEYKLVGYVKGQNETSESAQAAISNDAANTGNNNANDWYLRPQMPKKGTGADEYGVAWGESEQNRATVGREPLVRVALKDTISNRYAAVGYLKFVITERDLEVEDTYKHIESEKLDSLSGYNLECPENPFQFAIDWYTVETEILKVIGEEGISKDQFETEYKPVFATPDAYTVIKGGKKARVLQQYAYTAGDVKQTVRAAADTVGTVAITEFDDQETMTNVIGWNINAEYLYNEIVLKGKTHFDVTIAFEKPETITVGWEGHQQSKTLTHYVYVTFNWKIPAEKLFITPQGTISDDVKINNMWYTAWSNQHGGFAEVHQNVAVPHDDYAEANCTYVGHMLYPFDKQNHLFINVADKDNRAHTYLGYQDEDLTKFFNFCKDQDVTEAYGVSGRKYKISKSADGLGLVATYGASSATIAKISSTNYTTTGTWDSDYDGITVTYQENDIAKDLLSAYSSDQLAKGETLTGSVDITAKNECEKWLPLVNNHYNLRFLRPVNLTKVKDGEMTDAENMGSTVKVADLLDLSDWRYSDPISLFSTHKDYYTYYGVKSVKVGYIGEDLQFHGFGSGSVKSVTYVEDLNNTKLADLVTLDKVTPRMDIVFTPATTVADATMGELTYYNNGENFNKAFYLYVPVVVEYKWGWLVPGAYNYASGDKLAKVQQQYLKIKVNPSLGGH